MKILLDGGMKFLDSTPKLKIKLLNLLIRINFFVFL
ncbi:MAG: hypothetical protein Ct9H90mP22_9010 [Gammaproteobacteria bacterium]|nr:MAG: hypothetical protein Ct9H90mP22_9010 [Gammaproteobacteria bacterium]